MKYSCFVKLNIRVDVEELLLGQDPVYLLKYGNYGKMCLHTLRQV